MLFGGCSYVPDISSLQAWLECAWAAGFDASGAEQLSHAVQGSHKWVRVLSSASPPLSRCLSGACTLASTLHIHPEQRQA